MNLYSPSQIACTVTTMQVTCTQTFLDRQKFMYDVDFSVIPQRPLHFMKIWITSTTAFLIPCTVVPNAYSHSKLFHPQSSATLSSVSGSVNIVDLSQSDIHILYNLQIDNEFWRTNSWFMVSVSDFLHCSSFQLIKNSSATM